MPYLDLLIDKSHIKQFAQMSKHLNEEDQLQHHIRAAQNVDIEPVLGNVFFFDMIENRDDAKYTLLLNGGSYDFDNKTYHFMGLRAALACYAYGRYVLTSNIVNTPFGTQTKQNAEYAMPVSSKQLQEAAQEKKSEALKYLSDCLLFLNRKASDYPLWSERSSNINSLPQTVRFGRPKKY